MKLWEEILVIWNPWLFSLATYSCESSSDLPGRRSWRQAANHCRGDKPGWIGLACYYKNNEAKFAFETGYDSRNAAQDAVFAAIRNESGAIASGYPIVFQNL